MILLNFRGGGATRKTGSCCGLDLCHSKDKDNSSPKIEEFYEKMKRHSGLAAKSVERKSKRDFMPLPGDPESINADRNRLRLGGRSDEGGKIIPSSYRHSELDSESINEQSKLLSPTVILNLFQNPVEMLNQVQHDKSLELSLTIKQNRFRLRGRNDGYRVKHSSPQSPE